MPPPLLLKLLQKVAESERPDDFDNLATTYIDSLGAKGIKEAGVLLLALPHLHESLAVRLMQRALVLSKDTLSKDALSKDTLPDLLKSLLQRPCEPIVAVFPQLGGSLSVLDGRVRRRIFLILSRHQKKYPDHIGVRLALAKAFMVESMVPRAEVLLAPLYTHHNERIVALAKEVSHKN